MNVFTLILMFLALFGALFRRGYGTRETRTYPEQSTSSQAIDVARTLREPRKKFYRNDIVMLLLVLVIILLVSGPA